MTTGKVQSRTRPRTEVSHGPRMGLRQRIRMPADARPVRGGPTRSRRIGKALVIRDYRAVTVPGAADWRG